MPSLDEIQALKVESSVMRNVRVSEWTRRAAHTQLKPDEALPVWPSFEVPSHCFLSISECVIDLEVRVTRQCLQMNRAPFSKHWPRVTSQASAIDRLDECPIQVTTAEVTALLPCGIQSLRVGKVRRRDQTLIPIPNSIIVGANAMTIQPTYKIFDFKPFSLKAALYVQFAGVLPRTSALTRDIVLGAGPAIKIADFEVRVQEFQSMAPLTSFLPWFGNEPLRIVGIGSARFTPS